MKPSLLALAAIILSGCATTPDTAMQRVHAGMDRDQVQSIIGPPESAAYAPGKDCAYYNLLKDFWLRTPWSLSNRYYVCYGDGKVESFGRVDATTPGL